MCGCFAFLGGVPKVVVPDNLKAAVLKVARYDPGLNRTYAEMAEHYGTAVLPARPRKPRDKAKVEVAVQVAQRWIVVSQTRLRHDARLGNRRFFSLAELNAAIRRLRDELNMRQMRGYGASRADPFATLDRPHLQPLPAEAYAFARWKRARVAPDYHVEVDSSWYSVPFGLIRQEVDVRTCGEIVEVFHKGQRVASHLRCKGRERPCDAARSHAPPPTGARRNGPRPECWPRPRSWGHPSPPFAKRSWRTVPIPSRASEPAWAFWPWSEVMTRPASMLPAAAAWPSGPAPSPRSARS